MVGCAGVADAESDRHPVQEPGLGGRAGPVIEIPDKENDLVGSLNDFTGAEERGIGPAVRIGGGRLHQGRRALRSVPPQFDPHPRGRPAGGDVENVCGQSCGHCLAGSMQFAS